MVNCKRYCFTLNNYTDDEYTALWRSCQDFAKYAIVGREVGESGTPHLQGFVTWRESHSFAACKDRLHARCHVEIARGTPKQNRDYCRKGGLFVEQGELGETGASSGRSSRDEIAQEFELRMEARRSGMVKFASERRGTYYFHGSEMLRNWYSLQPAIDRPNIRVRWFYGLPATGKSRQAHTEWPEAYIKDPRTKWWNGYLLEEEVIIDDFGPGGIDINHLLRWFDRYRCLVESKGGMLPLHANNFIITSNFHPEDIFVEKVFHVNQNTDDVITRHVQLPALLRRIELIKYPISDYILSL